MRFPLVTLIALFLTLTAVAQADQPLLPIQEDKQYSITYLPFDDVFPLLTEEGTVLGGSYYPAMPLEETAKAYRNVTFKTALYRKGRTTELPPCPSESGWFLIDRAGNLYGTTPYVLQNGTLDESGSVTLLRLSQETATVENLGRRWLPVTVSTGVIRAGFAVQTTALTRQLNRFGQTVGEDRANGERIVSLFRNEGPATPLGVLAGFKRTQVVALNEVGQVVGTCDAERANQLPLYPPRAFLYQQGKMEFLPLPEGFDYTEARGLNNKGDVIGSARQPKRNGEVPLVWRDGQVILLALPEEKPPSVTLNEINDRGDIIASMLAKGYLWRRGQENTPIDLNWVSEHKEDEQIGEALSINNKGQILVRLYGIGTYMEGDRKPSPRKWQGRFFAILTPRK